MAEIRHAVETDLPALVALGRVMHAEAPALSHAPFNAAKVGRILEMAITSGIVLLHISDDGEIDGGFVGVVMERWFSLQRYMTDLGLFVHPDRRGGLIACRLISAVLDWCQARGIAPADVVLGITTGVQPEVTGKLLERMGFSFVGGNYQLRSY